MTDALEAAARTTRGAVRITAIRGIELDDGFAIVRVDTDAGVSGFGECGHTRGNVLRSVIAQYSAGGRLPHLGLLGRDPLDIRVLHHDMFHAYPQRYRNVQVLSGIDMALWDLAGKLLGLPVHALLGGKFRDEVGLYSHCPQGNFLDKGAWADRAAELKGAPFGFTAYKVDIHSALGIPMQQYTPNLGPQEIRRVARSYELAREALGEDIDIIVHCHNELDLPSAIQVARVVEPIAPLWFEDPLQPAYNENWLRLRASTRIPMMTGENIELAEQAVPFLINQAVDALQPDIVNSGGITGTKMIADAAALFRVPVTLHNVSGLLLNMASQQLAASVFDCPRIECTHRASASKWAKQNPLDIRDGKMRISDAPGLGVDLDMDYLEAHLAEGEPWWGT